jgi:hypothetical protein
VLRIRDVDPGSDFFHPGSRVDKIPDPDVHQRIKGFPDPDVHQRISSDFFSIPDPGVKKSSGSRICNTDCSNVLLIIISTINMLS